MILYIYIYIYICIYICIYITYMYIIYKSNVISVVLLSLYIWIILSCIVTKCQLFKNAFFGKALKNKDYLFNLKSFAQSHILFRCLSVAAFEQSACWLCGMFMICINQHINLLVNFFHLWCLNIFINLIKCSKYWIC